MSPYLADATRAMSFTNSKIQHGAFNRIDSNGPVDAFQKVALRVAAAPYFSIPRWLQTYKVEHFSNASMLEIDELRKLAAHADKVGLGNCMEHAATAFLYLFDLNVSPIVFCGNVSTFSGHAFVMLGSSVTSRSFTISEQENAVICDPWDRVVFEIGNESERAKSWMRKWGGETIGGLRFTL